jgi:hypothetical protein
MTTTATRKPRAPKAAKPLIVIARYLVKSTKAIVYTFRPSKPNETQYVTTVINGRATGCTCPARTKFSRFDVCKHMGHAEGLESARALKAVEPETFEKTLENASLNGNRGFSLMAQSLAPKVAQPVDVMSDDDIELVYWQKYVEEEATISSEPDPDSDDITDELDAYYSATRGV